MEICLLDHLLQILVNNSNFQDEEDGVEASANADPSEADEILLPKSDVSGFDHYFFSTLDGSSGWLNSGTVTFTEVGDVELTPGIAINDNGNGREYFNLVMNPPDYYAELGGELSVMNEEIIVQEAKNFIEITFKAIPGVIYELETSTDLRNWLEDYDVTADDTGSNKFTRDIKNTEFFRVIHSPEEV